MRHGLKALALAPLLLACNANAGLIAADGNEWELRGPVSIYSGHVDAAGLDGEWIWASYSDWMASGLDNLVLDDLAKSAFEGDCDLLPAYNCYGWLSDEPFPPNPGWSLRGYQIFTDGSNYDASGSWHVILNTPLSEDWRVVYRAASVPEPSTLALFGLGLLGLGFARWRKAA